MLGEFLSWWAARLAELLPFRLAAPATAATVIEPVGSSLRLLRRRGGQEREVGLFAADPEGLAALARRVGRHGVALRLGAEALLDRRVDLPLAAERAPEGLLRYELDQLTPFRSNEIAWGWAVEARDIARKRLALRLLVVPRDSFRPLERLLSGAGLLLESVEAPDSAGVLRRVPLRPEAEAASRAASQRRLGYGVACCAALAMVAVALPFAIQWRDIAAAEDRIAALRPAMTEVEALRRRIAGGGAEADAIAWQRAEIGDPLRLIAALTERLPDDSFLTELGIADGEITLRGQSASAARLIALLAAEPALRDPAFVAPVRRNEDGRGEVFALRARFGP